MKAFFVGTALDEDLQNKDRIKQEEARAWVDKTYLLLGQEHTTILETIEL